MQSMIKRDVNIAITPHIELITQMILDAVEVTEYRRGKTKKDFLCRDDAIYHRFLRQTGHTTALKHILSKEFLQKTGLPVIGVFSGTQQLDNFLVGSELRNMHNTFSVNQLERGDVFVGRKPKVLVVSDALHDPSYQTKVWEVIKNNQALQLNLTLVVFLG